MNTIKTSKREKKRVKACAQHQTLLRKSVIQWVLNEFDNCEFVEKIINRGIKKQFLYKRLNAGRHQPLTGRYVDQYKDVPTLEIYPVKGGLDSVLEKIEEMGLRKCPGSGWNVGTKVYIIVIRQQNKKEKISW